MKYEVSRHESGVWASDENPAESASRLVAIDAMVALGLDPNDFRTRDKIITGISDRINGMLDDAVAQTTVFGTWDNHG